MRRKTGLTIEKIWAHKLEVIIETMKRERKGLPKGVLVVNRQPKGIVFYMKTGGKPKGITRKKNSSTSLRAERTLTES